MSKLVDDDRSYPLLKQDSSDLEITEETQGAGAKKGLMTEEMAA